MQGACAECMTQTGQPACFASSPACCAFTTACSRVCTRSAPHECADVISNGLVGDVKALPDLPCRQPARQEPEHVVLSRGQMEGRRRWCLRYARDVPGEPEDADDPAVVADRDGAELKGDRHAGATEDLEREVRCRRSAENLAHEDLPCPPNLLAR